MAYKVADISLAPAGKLLLAAAEAEMPGLASLTAELSAAAPLKDTMIALCIHCTAETMTLIKTLTSLGAKVAACSCNIFSSQDSVCASMAADGYSVFAWKGQTVEEGEWCITKCLELIQQWGTENSNAKLLLIDDGGDLTEQARTSGLLAKTLGVCEETTTGVKSLYRLAKDGLLDVPAIAVNDSVTKSKFDNLYGCRESLVDAIKRATDLMIAGKVAVVAGFGDVGKGCVQALSRMGCRTLVTEVDPICALQAVMEGYEVTTMEDAASRVDIVVTATGNDDIVRAEHFSKMKPNTIVCNIGHFDTEIQVNWLNENATKKTTIKPLVEQYELPQGGPIILLAAGRLVNLGCATGHPSYVMSCSFTNQALAAIELRKNDGKYKNGEVYVLPKELDEKVAALHLPAHSKLTTLSKPQAEYIGCTPAGPFKRENYRY